jgi:hypothetical protein
MLCGVDDMDQGMPSYGVRALTFVPFGAKTATLPSSFGVDALCQSGVQQFAGFSIPLGSMVVASDPSPVPLTHRQSAQAPGFTR